MPVFVSRSKIRFSRGFSKFPGRDRPVSGLQNRTANGQQNRVAKQGRTRSVAGPPRAAGRTRAPLRNRAGGKSGRGPFRTRPGAEPAHTTRRIGRRRKRQRGPRFDESRPPSGRTGRLTGRWFAVRIHLRSAFVGIRYDDAASVDGALLLGGHVERLERIVAHHRDALDVGTSGHVDPLDLVGAGQARHVENLHRVAREGERRGGCVIGRRTAEAQDDDAALGNRRVTDIDDLKRSRRDKRAPAAE